MTVICAESKEISCEVEKIDCSCSGQISFIIWFGVYAIYLLYTILTTYQMHLNAKLANISSLLFYICANLAILGKHFKPNILFSETCFLFKCIYYQHILMVNDSVFKILSDVLNTFGMSRLWTVCVRANVASKSLAKSNSKFLN